MNSLQQIVKKVINAVTNGYGPLVESTAKGSGDSSLV